MKKGLRKLLGIFVKSVLWFIGITCIWVMVYRYVNPPFTYYMLDQNASINKTWKNYAYISENFTLAVIAAEDQRFFDHNGFDFEQIEKAIDKKQKGNKLRGASTISQQVAKNVFLWHGRSWIRKGLEVYFTALIELCWSKKRIIEIYMNVVELGEGVYGVEVAARKFYKQNAMQLTVPQAALLAAVLPNPKKYSVSNPTEYIRSRQNWIMQQMRNLGGTSFLQQRK